MREDSDPVTLKKADPQYPAPNHRQLDRILAAGLTGSLSLYSVTEAFNWYHLKTHMDYLTEDKTLLAFDTWQLVN